MKWIFPKWITTLIASVAGIIAITTFIINKPFIAQKKLSFDVYVDKIVLMSNKTDSLTIMYNDKAVTNVWKVKIIANNIGKNSIVGVSAYSDIYNDTIHLQLDNNFHIISHDIIKNEINGNISLKNDCFYFSFYKWNSRERLEIEVLITNELNDKRQPQFIVNERDIVNADLIINTIDLTSDNYYESNFDWLIKIKQIVPSWILIIGKWSAIILFGILGILMIPIWICMSIAENVKYRKWEKQYLKQFFEQVNLLEISDIDKNKFRNAPYSVPKEFLSFFSIPLPEKPDGIFLTIWVCIIGFLFFTLPLGLCALFAYHNL